MKCPVCHTVSDMRVCPGCGRSLEAEYALIKASAGFITRGWSMPVRDASGWPERYCSERYVIIRRIFQPEIYWAWYICRRVKLETRSFSGHRV